MLRVTAKFWRTITNQGSLEPSVVHQGRDIGGVVVAIAILAVPRDANMSEPPRRGHEQGNKRSCQEEKK